LRRRFNDILEVIRGERFERVFVFLTLFLATGALLPLWRHETGYERDEFRGDPLIQALWLLVYVTFLLLVYIRWREVLATALRGKLILLLVAIVAASVLWSTAPEVTVRRSGALTMTTLVGIYIAARFTVLYQLKLLAGVFALSAVLSLLFVFSFPQYGLGTGPNAGAWEGIFLQKNVLGRYMAFGAMVFFLLAAGRYIPRPLGWAGFGLMLVLVFFSASTTALMSLLVFAIVVAFFLNFRRIFESGRRLFFVLSGLVGAAFVMVFLNLSAVLGVFGKNITLTGRSGLWNVLIVNIERRPLLGFGYGGFWLGGEGPSERVWRAIPWQPTHAHNGFLELMLGVGLVGLVVFLAGFILYLTRALVWAHAAETLESLWPVVFFISLVLYSSTQSVLLEQNNILWMIYVATALSVPISLRAPESPVTVPRWLQRPRRVR
jgi:exopolysaccharide production protein ExoQ